MRTTYFLLVLTLGIAITSCSDQGTKKTNDKINEEYTPPVIKPDVVKKVIMNDNIKNLLLMKGREVTIKAQVELKQELQKAIKKDGLEYAISFCNNRAMKIMDSISLAEQLIVKRLAKKNRNPYNEMTENTSKIYNDFINQSVDGNRIPEQIREDEEGRPVYYKIISTDALCLNCHGKPGVDIDPKVAKKIAEIYPDDKAINFEDGHPRGMWAVTFPQYKVVDEESSKPTQ